ncbi:MAG: sugar ABC transporter permease [Treponema sp.]|nr:sugar ABC transporter permease [Treponema sp.]MDE5613069.1 ABC transporter permease subunit [Treponemataceae bacterium]MBD5427836.1 sugar ABC transporter permease [Treponema sp.]MBD5446293.1 sugar ABC transporter permease [Treponema sp.]MDE5797911.1 ABC transporter permease subunit [Treponemataceae bacterium]
MNETQTTVLKAPKKDLWKDIKRHFSVYVLLIIPLVYYTVLKYGPIVNGQIAFKDFSPLDGVWGSKWIGFGNFMAFFKSFYFGELLRNTILYSLAKLIISVPLSVILAVALYECTRNTLRRVVQTMVYLPHFLSWVIMYGILLALLAPGDGIVNDIIEFIAGKEARYDFLTQTNSFPVIVVLSDAWKEMGWAAIVFIAALMGIDGTLFEAAMVEGATAVQRVWYITIPSIKPVIVTVVLLKLGTILDAGFNQMFMLYSIPVYSVADIIDTWVYRQGLLQFQFALATAVGIFKGVIGFLLVRISNTVVKKLTDSALI